MSTRARTSQKIASKIPLSRKNERKVVNEGNRLSGSEKAITTNVRQRNRQQKLALLQDVDRLKNKLRYEENIHKALQRAFNRPLGARPRLPPYLPPNMVSLVAEIAVLEEEVVRLEEQLVTYWQNLYPKSALICSEWNSDKLKETQLNLQKASPSKSRAAPPSLDSSSDQSSQESARIVSTSPVTASDHQAKSSCDLVDRKLTRKEQQSYQESVFTSSNTKLKNPTEFYVQSLSDISKQGQPKLQKSSSSDQAKTSSPSVDIAFTSDQMAESSCDFANSKQTQKEKNSSRTGEVKGNQTHCSPKQQKDVPQHKRSSSGSFLTGISGSLLNMKRDINVKYSRVNSHQKGKSEKFDSEETRASRHLSDNLVRNQLARNILYIA